MIAGLEKQPAGLSREWAEVWQGTRAALVERGTWGTELKPFLDEYVFALIAARAARKAGHHAAWDRASRRAFSLADLLVITPRSQRLNASPAHDDGPPDPFRHFSLVDPEAS